MEIKTEGIVLRATDYKENDKILTLFTPSLGKITAGIRGVRKANAKLNFAAQPFAFCEYVLAEKGGRYTVTGAYLHDGFFSLRADILRFYAGCTLTETCNVVANEGEESDGIFIALAQGLKELALEETNPAESVISFLLTALTETGYMIDLDGCGVCGGQIKGAIRFDFSAGHFLCEECDGGVRASEETYETIRKCAGLDYRKGHTDGGRKRALRLLKAYLTEKTEELFPCFSEFIRMYEEN